MAEKNVSVKVILDPPGSNPPFHFESTDLPIDKDNVIYFSNCGKSKGFLIRYTIVDTANPGYRFPTHSNGNDYLDQALWATASGTCPTEPSNWDSVFKARSVEGGGLTLVVWNKNEVAQNFAYTLRVIKGASWLNLDPGGSNQNGGIPLFKSLAASVATGAIVGLASIATASSAFDASSAVVYGIGGAIIGLIVGFLFDRA